MPRVLHTQERNQRSFGISFTPPTTSPAASDRDSEGAGCDTQGDDVTPEEIAKVIGSKEGQDVLMRLIQATADAAAKKASEHTIQSVQQQHLVNAPQQQVRVARGGGVRAFLGCGISHVAGKLQRLRNYQRLQVLALPHVLYS